METLGRHVLLDLFDCNPGMINNLEAVKSVMIEAAKRARATIVNVVFHEFSPAGLSVIIMIAESHLSIHTWPEHCYAAVDIFSCGENMPVEAAAAYIVEQFKPGRTSMIEVKRGAFMGVKPPGAEQPTPS